MDASTDEGGTEGTSLVKRVLIFVVAPALIAGFFSIAPKLYEEFTRPVATLSHSVVVGPAMPSGPEYRRIFGITVANTGKTSLTNIEVVFQTPGARVEGIVAEKTIIRPEISTSGGDQRMFVMRMLPGERVSLSMSLVSQDANSMLKVISRSNEVIGALADSASSSKKNYDFDIIGAVLSSISVALMALSTALYVSRRRYRKYDIFPWNFTSIVSDNRSDIIVLIAGLCRVIPVSGQLLMNRSWSTYRRLADVLLIVGLKGDVEERARCVLALKSLLLVGNMHADSRKIVRENLKELGVVLSDREFDGEISKADVLSRDEMRAEIVSLLRGEGAVGFTRNAVPEPRESRGISVLPVAP